MSVAEANSGADSVSEDEVEAPREDDSSGSVKPKEVSQYWMNHMKWNVDEGRIRLLCQWSSCKTTAYMTPDQLLTHVSQHIHFCGNLYSDSAQDQGDGTGSKPILFHCPWYQSRCKTVLADIAMLAGHCYNHVHQDKLRAVGLYIQNSEQLPDCRTTSVDEMEWTSTWPEFTCRWADCDTQTYVTYRFYEHVNIHLQELETETTCKWQGCNKSLPSKGKLKQHLKMHTHEKAVICSVCQKSFYSNTGFIDHIRRRQRFDDISKFPCSVCSKVFPNAHARTLHSYIHEKGDSTRYQCSHCHKQLSSKSSLQTHVKYHHEGNVRRYQCSVCDYKAKTVYDCRRHEKQHIPKEERMFKCNIRSCNFYAQKEEDVVVHKTEMHGIDTEIKVFGCHLCESKYKRAHDLVKHLFKEHKFTPARPTASHARDKRFVKSLDGLYRLNTALTQ